MKWIGQHIYDLAARFRGDVTIEGDLTVNGTYTQIDTDVTTTEQWLVTNDGTGPAAIINQKGSQDIFDVQDDGTSVFYIEDGGNVGVGTTSPSQKLDVAGSVAADTFVSIQGVDTGNPSAGTDELRVSGYGVLGRRNSGVYLSNEASGPLYFGTGGRHAVSTRMTIDSSGNVGIGTTSPSNKLSIKASSATEAVFGIQYSSTTTNFLEVGVSSHDSYLTLKNSGTTEVIKLNSDGDSYLNGGNVGIGTSSPASKLHVEGAVQIGVNDAGHDFTLYGDTANYNMMWDASSSRLEFNDNTKAMFGNGVDLQIYHTGSHSNIKHDGTGDLIITQATADQDIIFKSDDGSGGETAYLTLDGSASQVLSNVTLKSTPPNANTHSLVLGRADTGNVWNVNHAGNDFRLYNTAGSGSDILFGVDSGSGAIANKVGIGVATPASLLHVAGTVQVGVDDAGHDVKFYGATSGKYMLWDESDDRLWLTDNTHLELGTGGDLQMLHNGSASFIQNYGGDLKIINNANDKDIIFQSDDGSGGVATYLTLDGSLGYTIASKQIRFSDGVNLYFGNSNDVAVKHDGTDFSIANNTGDLYIQNKADDKDIIFQSDDGSGGVETYFFLDGSNGHTTFPDGKILSLGTSRDLTLQHDGNNSYINANGTGDLIIKQMTDDKDISFQCDNGSGGTTTYLLMDGSNSLQRFYTSVYFGANASGHDVVFYGATSGTRLSWDTSQDSLIFLDNTFLRLGTGGDVKMWHNGTDSYMMNLVGDLHLLQSANDKDIILSSDDGSGGTTAYLTLDGSATKIVVDKDIYATDNVALRVGTGGDFRILHDATNSMMVNTNGDLYFNNQANDKDIIFKGMDDSSAITALTLDMSDAGTAIFNHDVKLNDNGHLNIGSGNDLKLYHDGSDSYVRGYNHDLIIMQDTADKDIKFKADDGSGGTATYLTLDGGLGRTTVQKNMQFADNAELWLGDGPDFKMYHDGSNTHLQQLATGNLYIQNTTDDADIIFQSDNGSGGTTPYLTLDGGDVRTNVHKEMRFDDNTSLKIGSGGDLVISHNGNNYIGNVNGHLDITQYADDRDIIFQADDGSGGTTPYLTLDGSAGHTVANKEIHFLDNVLARFGSTNDFAITHNGTNTTFENNTGDMVFSNYADDKDIIFQSDDGSGGVETYFFLDGSLSGGNPRTIFPDNSRLGFGNSGDTYIEHDGSNGYIGNSTGHLYIRQNTGDGDIIFQSDDGSGGLATYLQVDGGSTRTRAFKDINFDDNIKATYGAGSDLKIYHYGTGSMIENETGPLQIKQDADDEDIQFFCDDGSGGLAAYLTLDGSAGTVEIAKDTNVSGNVTVGVDDTGHDVKFFGATSGRYLLWDESADSLEFTDNAKAVFGIDNDMKLYHDASNSYITANGTGHLYIMQQATDADISFQSDDGSGGNAEYLRIDGGDEQVKVFKNLTLDDNIQAWFGSGNDLRIYHDASNSYIDQQGTGNLIIRNTTDDADIIFQSDDGSGGLATYLTLDGGLGYTTVQKRMRFDDNTQLQFGNDGDLQFYHTGGVGVLYNNTGDFYFRQNTDDKDIIFQCDDGSGGTTAYLTLDGSAGTIEVAKTINSTAAITSAATITADTYFASSDAAVVLAPASAGTCYLRPNGVGSGTGAFSVSSTGKATVSGELEATSLDINGNADISGDLTGVDTLTATTLSVTNYGLASGDIPNNAADTTGSAATLTEARAINGVDFDGSAAITVTAAAGTLSGSTLKSTVLASSLTSVGTISSGSWRGTPIDSTYIADNAINSQHYADGSIDTAHIADDQVTFAKASGVTPNVYDNTIKLLPSDFVTNDNAGVGKFGIGYVDQAGGSYGMKPTHADVELYTFVSIPQGMKATHVDIYDKYNKGVIVYEAQINATTLTSKGTGNCNTQIDITDVNSTATNFLAIQVTTTATSDRVFGGQVTIAAI